MAESNNYSNNSSMCMIISDNSVAESSNCNNNSMCIDIYNHKGSVGAQSVHIFRTFVYPNLKRFQHFRGASGDYFR